MAVEEGSTLGDGCLRQRDRGNGETKDRVAKGPQSLVAGKLSDSLPCWETPVSKRRAKLLDTANAE